MPRVSLAAALAVIAWLAPACGGGPAAGTLTVFAASSLTDAFTALAAAFEAGHPGIEVTVNFAGSSSLREQVLAGAPADVFAAAAVADMDSLAAAGALAGEARIFARNTVVIAVPAGNPAGIAGPEDFARPSLLIGLCSPEVPCGRYAREALAAAGVTPSPDTLEPDARALLSKIAAGELDAGIVYATDAAAAEGAVEAVVLSGPVADYPIAVLAAAAAPGSAALFVAFVLSPEGQSVLASYGFEAP